MKSETPFAPGAPFTSLSARRGPEPCQVASIVTRPTTSAPDESRPMLERPGERRLVERAVPHQDPARRAAAAEEVAVDPATVAVAE